MGMFKKKVLPIPEPYSAADIRIESSICTGEKTIGFYDKGTKKLVYSELVRSEADINELYRKYGVERNNNGSE